MTRPTLRAGLLACAVLLGAAGPVPGLTYLPGYQINPNPQFGSASFAYMAMCTWLDTSNVSLFTAGQPTPCSPLSPLPVQISGGSSVSGTVTANQGTAGTTPWPVTAQGGAPAGSPPAVPPVPVSGVDGNGNKQHLKVATDGTVQVGAAALPLPAGAATDANIAPYIQNLQAVIANSQTGAGLKVAPSNAVHTTAAQITIAAGGSAVVLAAGKIATGCDIVSSGAYVWAYTTAAAPGTATASATTGLPLSAGQSYHCPTPAPTQGLSIYNPGSSAITIGADSY